jgi:hypothetical protein
MGCMNKGIMLQVLLDTWNWAWREDGCLHSRSVMAVYWRRHLYTHLLEKYLVMVKVTKTFDFAVSLKGGGVLVLPIVPLVLLCLRTV